jgi:type I restriction enzyme S subunit
MEVKPGYKLTEVGVIPEEWEVVTATDACELVVDCKNRTPPVVPDSDFAVVRTPNVRNGQFVLDELRFTDEESYRSWTARAVPQLGDIMITREAPLGEVCAVPPNRKVCLGQRMMLYRPSPARTSSSYLLYSLMSETVRESLFRKIGGSTVGHAKVDDIRFLQLPLPPLPEQHAIATALSDVDGLLGGLDRLIAKKRDVKQAAMQQLLTGQTRLPGFHGEWEVKRFGELVTPRHERLDPRRAGIYDFCIELEHIDSGSGQIVGSTSTGTQSSLKSVFYPGDVLFGKLRAYLRKYWRATRPGVCSTEIWVLVPRVDAATSEFLFQIVQTDEFIDAASNAYGTHMPRSDWNAVQNYELKKPPLAEQTAIAAVLTDMDAELAALAQRREKTRALKQAMMQELLTGKTRLV